MAIWLADTWPKFSLKLKFYTILKLNYVLFSETTSFLYCFIYGQVCQVVTHYRFSIHKFVSISHFSVSDAAPLVTFVLLAELASSLDRQLEPTAETLWVKSKETI